MMSDRTKSTSKCYESEVGGAPVSSSCISKNPATHKKNDGSYVSSTPHVEIDSILWLWHEICEIKYEGQENVIGRKNFS